MTQKEIEKASVDYQMSIMPKAIGGDAFADMVYKANINPAFIAGAEWAYEHPKDNPLEGILIHGNNDAYRIGYKKAIEKACEWLEANGNNTKEFIEKFKKAQEKWNNY